MFGKGIAIHILS